ncbi:MAG: D-glycerate dehydrogenase [Acidobacteria bacterium]|nr:D-glycerate dehydrogenase [Acidobacteriota bacterium]
MPKPRVLLDVPFPEFLEAVFTEDCELVPWDALSGDASERAEVTGILSYSHTPVGDAELDLLPRLAVVSNYGVGVDHIDVAAVTARGIPVGNTPGVVDGATADLAMALLLAVARNVVIGDAFARGPAYRDVDPGRMLGRDVFGRTLGVVGLGRIGREVARRARGFGMTVLYSQRRRDAAAESVLGVRHATLPALLSESDFVTLHVPLTPQTRGLIGEEELYSMRKTAFLVNTARGAVVDQDALLRALEEKRIAGAAIDVTDPEPLPRDHPLLRLENLVITPHLGTGTVQTRERMARMARENLLAGLAGRPLPYPVT